MSYLKRARLMVDGLLEGYRHNRKKYREAVATLHRLDREVDQIEVGQTIAQRVAQEVQEQMHRHIASIVSRCLSAVFDEPYQFRITFERKRGRTEARLSFVRDEEEMDPMTETGGGAVDIAAFALRLACLLLTHPKPSQVLFLDEPFKFVSEEYRGRLRTLLTTLSEELGVQFIVITHIQALNMGKVVHLE